MIQLKVNGVERSFDGDPEMPLLWYLRDILGLTGTKFGCGMALCGCCTVHLNGAAVRSCVTPMQSVGGQVGPDDRGLGRAADFIPCKKLGWRPTCPNADTASRARSCKPLRSLNPSLSPTDADIDDAMAGNICRCGTYQRIRAAIKAAAKEVA